MMVIMKFNYIGDTSSRQLADLKAGKYKQNHSNNTSKRMHETRYSPLSSNTLIRSKSLIVISLLLYAICVFDQTVDVGLYDNIHANLARPPETLGEEALLAHMTIRVSKLCGNKGIVSWVNAVSVQKLNVPDLVVIDQLNQQQQGRSLDHLHKTQNINLPTNNQPEAASLINTQDLNSNDQQQSQIKFECLISFDRRKDKNLIIKWHHDDRVEPIYQWIPELNKRSIAPQYRAYIAPIVTTPQQHQQQQSQQVIDSQSMLLGLNQNVTPNLNSNQTQLLEAGFKLVRPSKELGGKYTCSAISAQNDDSKWKKMIVFTPPRVFRFNASRIDISAQLASQRERLIQLSQPAIVGSMPTFSSSSNNQLPLAYRMKGFDNQLANPTTITPSMYSTIDYVNVNQQRIRSQSASSSPWLLSPPTTPQPSLMQQAYNDQSQATISSYKQQNKQNGIKLVCDIDQVFPVPEVSIYRLAKLDGSHPDKLAKLDTRIERNSSNGLYHVQVMSILEDDELQMKYGFNEPAYFECLITLTNLELSKYADNKRSIVYRPGLLKSRAHGEEDINFDQTGNSATNYILCQTYITLKALFYSTLPLAWVVYVSKNYFILS